MGQDSTAAPAEFPHLDELDVLQHELGNVLHGVACVAGLLRDSGLDAQQRRWLAAIERACDQAHALLDRTLRAAMPAPDGCFDGQRLLDDAVLAQRGPASLRGVAIALRCAPDLPKRWRGDPCLLRQLLDNLLQNALRHGGHGPVAVEAMRVAGERSTLVLRVRDSGPGVADAERLFLPYRRGAATADSTPGRGLGLFVCRRIAQGLGGEIRYVDDRSGGACFEVRLPGVLDAAEGG